MESQGRLLLRFEDDGDGTGKLLAHATSGGFSGEGGAWFSISELQDFAEAIGMFPIPEGNPPYRVSTSLHSMRYKLESSYCFSS